MAANPRRRGRGASVCVLASRVVSVVDVASLLVSADGCSVPALFSSAIIMA
jgi:hypothetical protein